jgi:hypothetical protein
VRGGLPAVVGPAADESSVAAEDGGAALSRGVVVGSEGSSIPDGSAAGADALAGAVGVALLGDRHHCGDRTAIILTARLTTIAAETITAIRAVVDRPGGSLSVGGS